MRHQVVLTHVTGYRVRRFLEGRREAIGGGLAMNIGARYSDKASAAVDDPTSSDEPLEELFRVSNAIHEQKREDKNKVYSVYAAEVERISKGKAHKHCEFGYKTSVVSTSSDNWILDIVALRGNPYVGHALKRALANAESNRYYKVTNAFCDKGCAGALGKLAHAKRKALKVVSVISCYSISLIQN